MSEHVYKDALNPKFLKITLIYGSMKSDCISDNTDL